MEERPPSLREQGIEALRLGDDDRAIDLLTRAVLVDSRDAEARACLGITASRKGLHVRALSALREAVALEPENPNFRYNLGVALERAGEPAEALQAYQETLQRAPEHAQARQKLASLGQPKAASAAEEAPSRAAYNLSEEVPEPISEEPQAAHDLLDSPASEEPPTAAAVSPDAPVLEESAAPVPASAEAQPGPPEDVPPPTLAPPSTAAPTAAPPPYVAPGSVPTTPPPVAWQQPPPTGYPAYGPAGYTPVPGYNASYLRPHRGGLILGLGISSLVTSVVCCPLVGLPLGIAAWVSGNTDLREIDAGAMDPSARGQIQTGRILGIITAGLNGLGLALFLVYLVIVFIAGASGAFNN